MLVFDDRLGEWRPYGLSMILSMRIAAFVTEARAAYSDPKIREEAIALAEEALPLDNEGLRVAEARGRYAKAAPGRRKTKRR